MNDLAIRAIMDYTNEHLFEPGANWPKCWFNGRTYSRWAANEILERIMDHPQTLPSVIAEEFVIQMEYYSHFSNDTSISTIFAIASEVASDILDLLYAME